MKRLRYILHERAIHYFSQHKAHIIIFFAVLFIVIIIATALFFQTERAHGADVSIFGAFWAVICTTFGAADFAEPHPVTPFGKAVILFLSLFGLAVVCFLVSELAGNFVLKKLKEAMGMSHCRFKNHYIICGWNSRGVTLVKELESLKAPLVIIAPESREIVYGGDYMYISGDPANDDILLRAGIMNASRAIILADESGGRTPDDTDARTILIALAIESMNLGVYTVIELLNPENRKHAHRANVDDIIYCNRLLADITASCALNEGLSGFLNDILSVSGRGGDYEEGGGSSFQIREIPQELQGKKMKDLFYHFRGEGSLPVALLKPPDGMGGENLSPAQWIPHINPEDEILIPPVAKVILIVKNFGV